MSISEHNGSIERQPATSTGRTESCQNCGATQLTVVYEVRRVPVHSCLLVFDATAAQRYPCGDIRLAFCTECGFISNLLFSASLQNYSPQYEDTQCYSKHFSSFSRNLANRWIENYDIRNKTILEIGCGKGDFLSLLCEIGDNKGIGLDPACDPRRLSAVANERITFICDEYSAKYGDLQADVVCCRHTLEHIHSTQEFVRGLRRALGEERDKLLLFELPDVTRILREQAFWDIYYEHCSYFTAGSLARLFRQNSFEVIDLRRDYSNQYLVLAARPSSGPTKPRFELEDDLEETMFDLEYFQAACATRARSWQARLRRHAEKGRKVVAWGSGSKCVSFCTTLGITDEFAYVVDVNPHKNGKFLPGTGHRIVEPDSLQQDPPDIIVAMNPVYFDEIHMELDRLGVEADLLTL